jgi:hypothetical protein
VGGSLGEVRQDWKAVCRAIGRLGSPCETVFDCGTSHIVALLEDAMRFRPLSLPALGVLTLIAASGGASAQNNSWCARYQGSLSCGFSTFEQCRASVSGAGGVCQPNPRGGGSAYGPSPAAAAAAAAIAKRAKAERAERAERAREAAEERRRAKQRQQELARQRQRAKQQETAKPAPAAPQPAASVPATPVPAAAVSGGVPLADLDVNAVPALNRDAIRRVQTVLKQKGFDPGPLNGITNPRMQDAVRAFQSHYGIEARGAIDNQTLLALGEAGLASQSGR